MNKVIIFSAPSGSGKTTLVKHALETISELQFSISCTTRQPRGSEVHAVDYHFLSPDEFRQKIAEDAFVEYEEVYTDKYYGTLKSEVEKIWNLGKVVIFDVDVKGGVSLKKYFGEQALSIFIKPPSIEELERRLVSRDTDDAETIRIRIEKSEEEMSYADQFDTIVVNDDLEKAKKEIELLIRNFIA
ncbi:MULTISPECIES: guanylate kinase [Chryseobacterium]|uniref:Guanylate kinase n=1 Tax=Chryseobacterium camelliae TaxID=1265445 RepID=A0ABU0TK87_9FLAO|nr:MULTISPECIES: guanylate kinase [Chryseobacterium]MDT3408694.1 guanylate kinase [Pseudacidovorax intermedius]MDQ1097452.1 guanylate kinase [Chryseobacterium camelliae]MDQ1101381.1 guanylate kinase [Chryseobacterium sp. SORGH_AS_1048]MDR6084825.1 guanylate kinase [Chryseobacterium sp. SORGH_AS_0909]MDR6129173.1 guanylate kinase [Chryseobacterium sp. SORGH_AS_1175]